MEAEEEVEEKRKLYSSETDDNEGLPIYQNNTKIS